MPLASTLLGKQVPTFLFQDQCRMHVPRCADSEGIIDWFGFLFPVRSLSERRGMLNLKATHRWNCRGLGCEPPKPIVFVPSYGRSRRTTVPHHKLHDSFIPVGMSHFSPLSVQPSIAEDLVLFWSRSWWSALRSTRAMFPLSDEWPACWCFQPRWCVHLLVLSQEF